ncbi:hypothetical protein N0V85_004003 [Neurospora sp. IMI 360204]|nr:hypothetical protein N0V85_004003 [Neurospora sp. IMI 360204]
MKFLLTIITLTAGLVTAQDVPDVPECALPCLYNAVTSATTCSDTDYKCWCTAANEAAIIQAGTACVLANCGSDIAIDVALPAFVAFCEEVNAS